MKIDLYHFLSHADLGSDYARGSSSWGWTSKDGREFVAIGQYDGTAFAEISSEGKLVYLGRLPQYDDEGSNWREIRILRDYAVVGSEAIHHGVQIFDMKKLLTLDPVSPTNFTQADLTGHWDELPVGRTHNIVVNEELNYAIAVGSVGGNETIRVRGDLPCRGGLIYLNMTDPENPWSPGCAAGDGYELQKIYPFAISNMLTSLAVCFVPTLSIGATQISLVSLPLAKDQCFDPLVCWLRLTVSLVLNVTCNVLTQSVRLRARRRMFGIQGPRHTLPRT
jgi:hypothetical protein